MEKPIQIVLANQHPIIRSDLRLLVERLPKFRVVGEAASGRDAVVLAEYKRPDIVLLDIQLPDINGMVTARQISSRKASLGIIFVSTLADEEYVSEAFKAGARGYVLGEAVQTDLFCAIDVVTNRGSFISPAITSKLIDEHATQHVDACTASSHEKQLCCLLAAGYDEREIAMQLQSTAGAIRVEYQNIDTTLRRVGAPSVIVDSVRYNGLRQFDVSDVDQAFRHL